MNPSNPELQATVKERFAKVAQSPDKEKKFRSAPPSAKKLGYDPKEIDALPARDRILRGVGNPLGLGEFAPGQTVLDLGSGAGLDSLLAARRVGPTGKVVGVDMCRRWSKGPQQRRAAGPEQRRVRSGRDREAAVAGRLRGRGDLQRRPESLPRQAEGAGRGIPGATSGRSPPDGRHPPA